jgi:hypothetical protein
LPVTKTDPQPRFLSASNRNAPLGAQPEKQDFASKTMGAKSVPNSIAQSPDFSVFQPFFLDTGKVQGVHNAHLARLCLC